MLGDAKTHRFTEIDLQTWKQDGAVLLESFFTPQEIAPVYQDFVDLYGTKSRAGVSDLPAETDGSHLGQFNEKQFTNIDNLPFDCSAALNLLGLHPALIELAKAALETENVHLYQSHSWAKYTGDTDYAQPFHCDYKNHTLTVPSDDIKHRTINFMIYVSDVTLESGAISYVPQSHSDPVTGPDRPMFVDYDSETQKQLQAIERRGPGPAGSIFAYGIDVYHRGMNMTAPGAHRFTLTASFKAAGNDMIGWSAWPFTFLKPWYKVFNNATPEQLVCLGVPLPGNAFWTERTIKRAQERWPDWDMSAYLAAL